jgi:hypothetical protein
MAKEKPEPVTPRDQIHHPTADHDAELQHVQHIADQNPEVAAPANPIPQYVPPYIAVDLFPLTHEADVAVPGVSPEPSSAPVSPTAITPVGPPALSGHFDTDFPYHDY